MSTPQKSEGSTKVLHDPQRGSTIKKSISNTSDSTGNEVVRIIREIVDSSGKRTFEVETRRPTPARSGGSEKGPRSNAVMKLEDISKNPANAKLLQEWRSNKQKTAESLQKKYQEGGFPIRLLMRKDMAQFETMKDELGMNDPDFPARRTPSERKDFEQELAETMAKALQYMDVQAKYKNPSVQATTPKASVSQLASQSVVAAPSDATQSRRRPRESNESNGEVPRQTGATQKPAKRPKIEKGKGRSLVNERILLQEKWTAAVGLAAPITIVNEVDDELIPSSIDPEIFEYLEQGPYHCGPDVPSHTEFLVGCQCLEACVNPDHCQCQPLANSAEWIERNGRREFAYDENVRRLDVAFGSQPQMTSYARGFTHFPTIHESLSSNATLWVLPYNIGPIVLMNRVAQRPRDVPLELFKTRRSGWGIRATQFVPKGKVIGVFTGDLVEDTDEVMDHWSFDLDWLGGDNKWRVSSKDRGNWSRFLNHSCYPNLKVYGVIYDCVLEDRNDVRHRLAFVATKDIEAYTELTIDYDPDSPPGPKGGKCCEFGGCAKKLTSTEGKKATK
ncbi:hypothetical protein FRC17_001156 [Serendipita sp. 399]|nr:hypothetical protein FRC17_001156 [Serendipita sp. 399]